MPLAEAVIAASGIDFRIGGGKAFYVATHDYVPVPPQPGFFNQIKPCIPGRKLRNKTVKYDKRRYKRRNRIEIMFVRLKGRRRVATRYDRCPKAFFSAVPLAATVIFWL